MEKYRCEKYASGAKDARRGGAKRLLQAYVRERYVSTCGYGMELPVFAHVMDPPQMLLLCLGSTQ